MVENHRKARHEPKKRRGGKDAQRAPGAIATKREPRRRKARGSPQGEGRRRSEHNERRQPGPGGGDPAQKSGERAQANEPQHETREPKRKKSKGGGSRAKLLRSLYPCLFVERSATPGGCRAEAFESAARGKSRTRSGG